MIRPLQPKLKQAASVLSIHCISGIFMYSYAISMFWGIFTNSRFRRFYSLFCASYSAAVSAVYQALPWKAVFISLSTSRYSWLSRFTGVHYTTTTLPSPPKPDEEISASCLSPLSRQPISERAAGARFVEKLK